MERKKDRKRIIGDYADILDDERIWRGHGVIYVDKSEDVLKKAVELIKSGSVEEEGLKARRFVKKYTWENTVADFESILEELT